MASKFNYLVEILRERAQTEPDTVLYTFIEDFKSLRSEYTYSELDQRARIIAGYLQTITARNDRALLLYKPGLQYIEAFIGCLYAGVIPVPAYPPDGRNLKRLMDVIDDANASIALSTEEIYNNVSQLTNVGGTDQVKKEATEFIANINWVFSDLISQDYSNKWKELNINREDVAFLQYTSGSTGNPKGVILTHGNLLNNFEFTHNAFGIHPNKKIVSWLPPYHDMGLIGGILQALYSGIPAVLMSPVSFIKRPHLWLQLISEQSKNFEVISGAPNFAYELCFNMISEENSKDIDLSNWTVAFNGAEPIRAETLAKFSQKFKKSGFKNSYFFPVYGLAEATLLVSAGGINALPINIKIDKVHLENNDILEVIGTESEWVEKTGCGRELLGQSIKIVDPDSIEECSEKKVGEIWISGPNVAIGYWNNVKETNLCFNQKIHKGSEETYFKTGDLGYFDKGELYVTGRLKDLIIIRGKNYYPQDIEYTVQHCHESLRKDCGAALSVDLNNEEHLVIIQEIKRSHKDKSDHTELISIIKSAISKMHQIVPYKIILIEASSFPKTSSGKLQRRLAKQMYLKDELKVLKEIATIY